MQKIVVEYDNEEWDGCEHYTVCLDYESIAKFKVDLGLKVQEYIIAFKQWEKDSRRWCDEYNNTPDEKWKKIWRPIPKEPDSEIVVGGKKFDAQCFLDGSMIAVVLPEVYTLNEWYNTKKRDGKI
jgi:hypothetical protein